MHIKKVNNISDIIKELYATDKKFIDKYHEEAGKGLDACCNRTIKDFFNFDISVYAIFDENKLIGYFGKESNKIMVGFFIVPEYRKYKEKIWSMVKKHFNYYFYTHINVENKPAYNFFKKYGNETFVFEYNNEMIAQIIFIGE